MSSNKLPIQKVFAQLAAVVAALLTLPFLVVAGDTSAMVWEQVASLLPQVDGRHHPITFANETHGFYLTGTSSSSQFTNDVYVYNVADDTWTDVTNFAAFPGTPRSFGYGVVLPIANHSKAYLGFGAAASNQRLNDLWEMDMTTLQFQQLDSCPGKGRRHPAMVAVQGSTGWEIHVGLGDGVGGNYNDWWVYSIDSDSWMRLTDFPSSQRHHPFYFNLGNAAYAGLGHSTGRNPYIERDWYRMDAITHKWERAADFESVDNNGEIVSTEARVAGTQFSIELDDPSNGLLGSLGFVLSGDGDDHKLMATGEFHSFNGSKWHELPPHPGNSRWAPGSFVVRGTAVAYFTSGYDRGTYVLHQDMWRIDLNPLFTTATDATTLPSTTINDISGTTTTASDDSGIADAGVHKGPETQHPTSSPVTQALTLSPTRNPTGSPEMQSTTLSPVATLLTLGPASLGPTTSPTGISLKQLPTTSPVTPPTLSPNRMSPTSSPITQRPTSGPVTRPSTSTETQPPTPSPVTQASTPSPNKSPTRSPEMQPTTLSPVAKLLTLGPASLGPTTSPTGRSLTQPPTTSPVIQRQTLSPNSTTISTLSPEAEVKEEVAGNAGNEAEAASGAVVNYNIFSGTLLFSSLFVVLL